MILALVTLAAAWTGHNPEGTEGARVRWVGEHVDLYGEALARAGGDPAATYDLPVYSGGTTDEGYHSYLPMETWAELEWTGTRTIDLQSFANLPDVSWSLGDWALGNELCPLADAPEDAQGADRLRRLFESTFGRFQEYEPQMRAALQLSLEHAALDRAGLLKEERYRRGYRVGLLKDALAPLRGQLTRRNHELLWKALSIVYGIEPYVILKDIWGARDTEVEAVARWMVEALTRHALREAPGAGRRRSVGSPARDDGDGSGAIELR